MATRTTTVQKVLAEKLPTLKPTEIKSLAATIATVQAKGLRVDDVFPEGIVIQDAVTIGGHLNPEDLTNLGDIVKAIGKLKGVQVFPRGIPVNPDMLRVKLTMQR